MQAKLDNREDFSISKSKKTHKLLIKELLKVRAKTINKKSSIL